MRILERVGKSVDELVQRKKFKYERNDKGILEYKHFKKIEEENALFGKLKNDEVTDVI